MKKIIIRIRNGLAGLFKYLAKKLYVPEQKIKYVRKGMRKTVAVLLLVGLFACEPTQKPSQTVINYTDNSQTIQVAGDGNQLAATTDIQAEQTTTPQQTTENTTEDNMWIFWLVLLGVAIGGGYLLYWYQKKRIL